MTTRSSSAGAMATPHGTVGSRLDFSNSIPIVDALLVASWTGACRCSVASETILLADSTAGKGWAVVEAAVCGAWRGDLDPDVAAGSFHESEGAHGGGFCYLVVCWMVAR